LTDDLEKFLEGREELLKKIVLAVESLVVRSSLLQGISQVKVEDPSASYEYLVSFYLMFLLERKLFIDRNFDVRAQLSLLIHGNLPLIFTPERELLVLVKSFANDTARGRLAT
jgi:hypothetical protein